MYSMCMRWGMVFMYDIWCLCDVLCSSHWCICPHSISLELAIWDLSATLLSHQAPSLAHVNNHPALWLLNVNQTLGSFAVFTVRRTGSLVIFAVSIRVMLLRHSFSSEPASTRCYLTGERASLVSQTLPRDRRWYSGLHCFSLPWVGVHYFLVQCIAVKTGILLAVYKENVGNVLFSGSQTLVTAKKHVVYCRWSLLVKQADRKRLATVVR
jgi:hypothetical protein